MLIVILICLLVMILGAVVYETTEPTNPKRQEIGRLMFFAGLLALLLRLPPWPWPSLHIGG
jgi:hypothetical protein